MHKVPPEARLGRLGFGFVDLSFVVDLVFSSAWMPVTLVVVDTCAEGFVPIMFWITP